jgi:hypothetical protein
MPGSGRRTTRSHRHEGRPSGFRKSNDFSGFTIGVMVAVAGFLEFVRLAKLSFGSSHPGVGSPFIQCVFFKLSSSSCLGDPQC